MRDDSERVLDIIEAIQRIEKYADIEKSRFESDELVQTWMVHNIQIIGEASSGVSDEFRLQHPDVPWRSIASMRNAIVHAYFRVDTDEVWNVIRNDLPILKSQLEEILR